MFMVLRKYMPLICMIFHLIVIHFTYAHSINGTEEGKKAFKSHQPPANSKWKNFSSIPRFYHLNSTTEFGGTEITSLTTSMIATFFLYSRRFVSIFNWNPIRMQKQIINVDAARVFSPIFCTKTKIQLHKVDLSDSRRSSFKQFKNLNFFFWTLLQSLNSKFIN